ncbi:hypothetical protein BBK36DRAFT_1170585 [Trichoderma citrinoviride]|uniref:Apple domain-containing protein n=1 Tax=Trichoderma citrinoviride TaxID=58853 RepID=A0A2T4B6I8_9HYPO|nr:hypothetical protein BBK36DRAFT_1170585 [Trichoderma citrinoviride]PTB64920.1 hypothetical protein BBK36DRAFT_1170585 [Trichoderma citrinoviride]
MKLLVLSAVLSALQAVEARDPACHPAAPSCQFVSPWTARECSNIIHSHHIRLSTCEAPEKTITKTVVATHHPTFTHTKTVKPAPSTKTSTKVITATDPVTQQDTTTAWATATAVSTTTAVTSDFTTATTTTTSVETETDSTTITTTQEVTRTVSWAPEVCTPTLTLPTTQAPTLAPTLAPIKRSDNHNDYKIPRDCSCFLTSTKSCGPRATKVVTRVEDRPTYITKTVTDRRNCETVTVTKTSITHINGAPPPKQTVTSTTTSTVVTTATSTSTVEQITTATEATTTTVVEASTVTTSHSVTATEDPCSPTNINKYLLPGPPSSPNVVLGFRGDGGNDASNCCQDCHMNSDCAWWRLSADGSLCEGYFTSLSAVVEGCTTTTCRRGHPLVIVDPESDGSTYGMGVCGTFSVVS